MKKELKSNLDEIGSSGNELINGETIAIMTNTQTIPSLKNYDTLVINAKNVIIKDMSLGIEIDLKGKINQFNKIIVDGITFVKENKDE